MLPLDKQAHFWAGMAIASALTAYGVLPLVSFGVAIVVAALKEARDALGYGTPDIWDFVATGLGAAVVLPLAFGWSS